MLHHECTELVKKVFPRLRESRNLGTTLLPPRVLSYTHEEHGVANVAAGPGEQNEGHGGDELDVDGGLFDLFLQIAPFVLL